MGANCNNMKFKNNWNFEGKKDWKNARAVCQKKPEGVIELQPGKTEIVDIEVLNDTNWPWKPSCWLTLSDEQNFDQCPIEVFKLPVEQEVKGNGTATFKIPLTMAQTIVADENKVYDVSFTFRGPKGNPYGSPIVLKVKCVLPSMQQVSDVEIYKLAIKLSEELQLGSIENCISAVREHNADEAECIKALQRKQE